MRVGAIDIGTNSIHLVIGEVAADGTYRVLEKAREQVELGAGGLEARVIQPEAFARGIDALVSFHALCKTFQVDDVFATATSAVREASNGDAFCMAVRARTDIHVRVITGNEEARYVWLGARSGLDFSRGRVLLFDLGGGSTEFVLGTADAPLMVHSVRLGHIRLADRFPNPTDADRRRMRDLVRAELEPLTSSIHPEDFATLVGTSGAVRTLAVMAAAREQGAVPPHEHGLVLTRRVLEAMMPELTAPDPELPGMDRRRRRTIGCAAIIVREILRVSGKRQLVTSERSLRDGLLLEWIARHHSEVELSGSVRDTARRSVLALMQRYGADHLHARWVADAALAIFDGTSRAHQLPFDDRRLLEFSALLHDIGHHVSGKAHHKHSEYLIRHSPMPGFVAPDVDVMAQVARYHRGSNPKIEHGPWAALSLEQRRRVRILAGCLRLADGLDRGHERALDVPRVEIATDGAVQIDTRARANGGELERWSAEQRAELLAIALERPVRIRFDDGQ
jgi:exopolyphosphatase/guanosine-5'-triphosphate,3'-diphosphate pyrophosphatase